MDAYHWLGRGWTCLRSNWTLVLCGPCVDTDLAPPACPVLCWARLHSRYASTLVYLSVARLCALSCN